jgi:hypothetical protein
VSNPEKQEGELYYRLRRQLATDGKAETKGMQGVLDEAKADFPFLKIEGAGTFLITTNSYEKAVADWFERWFGEVEKSE